MDASICICICTYRRPDLLRRCLESLREFAPDQKVLVVDNAVEARCEQICQEFGVQYVQESQTGLSHARNHGWRSSKAEWICYLDDDAKVRADTIRHFLAHLNDETLSGIGGRFEHYYDNPPPAWLKLANGRGMSPVENVTEAVLLSEGQKLFGGVMAFRRSVLETAGGFNTTLGMQGDAFGYGEESELQIRLQKAGHKLLYDPAIVIDHLYSPRKYSLTAHLKMSREQGRADRKKGLEGPHNVVQLLLLWLRLVFITLPITLLRWVFRHPEWKWQTVFMIVASKFANSWGFFRG